MNRDAKTRPYFHVGDRVKVTTLESETPLTVINVRVDDDGEWLRVRPGAVPLWVPARNCVKP